MKTEREPSDILAEFEEYTWKAQEFAKPNAPIEFYALGLLGEESEYQSCDKEENENEAGDVLWYLAGICASLGFPREDQVRELESIHVYLPHEVSEPIKKCVYHNRPMELDKLRRHIGAMLMHFAGTYPDAMRKNIEKLSARYPQGYVDGGGVRA